MDCIAGIGPCTPVCTTSNDMDFDVVNRIQMKECHLKGKKISLANAVCQNDTFQMELLIKRGVNVNAVLNKKGYCALHYAAERGFHSCVDMLLKAGATIERETYEHLTPLQLAVNNVQVKTVRILLEASGHDPIKLKGMNLKEVLQMLLSPVRLCTRKNAEDMLLLILTSTPNLEAATVYRQNQLFAIYRDFFLSRCLKGWLVTGNKFSTYQWKLLKSKCKKDMQAEVLNTLEVYNKIPHPLQQYCRLAIRQSFDGKCNVLYGVSRLPMPDPLKAYIAIPTDSQDLDCL